jgi:hypothetical protein
MFGWILIIAAMIVVVAFFLMKGKSASAGKGRNLSAKKAMKQSLNRYAGTEFIADAYGCDAVRR